MSNLQRPLVLLHPEGASGTTVWPDGTRAYWTERRGSIVVFAVGSGETAFVSVDGGHPALRRLNAVSERDLEARPMTATDVAEWARVREDSAPLMS